MKFSLTFGQTAEDARVKLDQLDIPYTKKAFIKHVEKGDQVVVSLLIKAGIDPTQGLIASVKTANTEMLNYLIYNGAEISGQAGADALATAVKLNNVDLTKFFLEHNVDVNYLLDGYSKTALDVANDQQKISFPNEYFEVIELLKNVGAKSSEQILSEYDTPPQPIGLEAIQEQLKCKIAKKAGIRGKIVVRIWISATGKIINTLVKQSIGHSGCDNGVIFSLKQLKWEPAKQKNKPVAAFVDFSVIFD